MNFKLYFDSGILEYKKNGLVIERFNYNVDFKSCCITNDNIYYFVERYLYKIEYLYIVNKFKTEDFKIYDILYENGVKEVIIRLLNEKQCRNIILPKLIKSYSSRNIYDFKRCYLWKRKDGSVREFLTDNRLYNRHEGRYYQVGDFNSYGHKLVRITDKKIFRKKYLNCDYVALNLNS